MQKEIIKAAQKLMNVQDETLNTWIVKIHGNEEGKNIIEKIDTQAKEININAKLHKADVVAATAEKGQLAAFIETVTH